MKIINYEEDKYRTLEYKDFLTTLDFPYEFANLKPTVNSHLFKGFKPKIILSSKSKHIKWNKHVHNFHNFTEEWKKDMVSNYIPSGMCRINIKEYDDFIFAKERERKNWEQDLHNFYNIFEKKKIALQNTVNGYLRMCLTKRRQKEYNDAFNKLKYYLNAKPDEFIRLYLRYVLEMYYKKIGIYSDIYTGTNDNKPYIYTIPNKVRKHNNLEAKPMKRKKEKRTFRFKIIGLIKGEWKTLFKTSDGLNYYNNDVYEKVLNVQLNKIDYSTLLQLKLIKTYNDGKVEIKQLKLKKKSQIIHSKYIPPKKRQFQVSYSKGGFDKKGLPVFQITNTIYGISVKSALRKYKIGFNNLIWIKEIVEFNTKEEEEYIIGIGTKEKIKTLYKRSLPLKNKKLEKRYKRIKKHNINKLENISKRIKDKHKSNKLVCIRFKDTIEIRRVPMSETKDGTYKMSEWNYTSKSKYKEFKNTREKIDPPKPNEEKQVKKTVANFEKRKKRALANRERELNKIRKKRRKYYKKIYYYIKDENGRSIKKVRYGGKKRKK